MAKKVVKKKAKKDLRKRNFSFGIIAALVLAGAFLIYLGTNNIKKTSITSFEECVAAGNPVMESYPRQCRANEKTFIESINSAPPPEILQISKGANELPLALARGNYIINSQKEWDALFGNTDINPSINFNEKTVIAVVMGQKPTGGYSVNLKQVTVGEDSIKFMVNETVPGESCVVLESLMNPYQIIAIEKTEKEISFLGNTIVEECGE